MNERASVIEGGKKRRPPMVEYTEKDMAELKGAALEAIEKRDANDVLSLIAQLKVTLLSDHPVRGGLNEESRKRAWAMVNELGKLFMGKGGVN